MHWDEPEKHLSKVYLKINRSSSVLPTVDGIQVKVHFLSRVDSQCNAQKLQCQSRLLLLLLVILVLWKGPARAKVPILLYLDFYFGILFQDVSSLLSMLIFGYRACLEPVSFLYNFKPLFMFSAIRQEAFGKQGLCQMIIVRHDP